MNRFVVGLAGTLVMATLISPAADAQSHDCPGFIAYITNWTHQHHPGGALFNPSNTAEQNRKAYMTAIGSWFGVDWAHADSDKARQIAGWLGQCGTWLRATRQFDGLAKDAAQSVDRLADERNAKAKRPQAEEAGRGESPSISSGDMKVTFQHTHIGATEEEFLASYRGEYRLTCIPHNPDDKGSPYLETIACFNPLAQSGRLENMDRVAGIPAFVSYLFRKPDKALFHIEGYAQSGDYNALLRAFIEKWGQPTKSERVGVQNQMGAQLENTISTWYPSAGVKIVLEQYSDGFPTSGSGQQYDLGSAFQIVHVPTELSLINKGRDGL
jgi:hypothetical protein